VGVLSGTLALYLVSTLLLLRVFLRQELDESLHAAFERVEDLLEPAGDGGIRMGGHGDEGEATSLVEVWSTQGELLYHSEALEGDTLGPRPTAGTIGASYTSSRLRNDDPVRVLTRQHPVGNRETVVRVAVREERSRREWRDLSFGLLLGLPVAILIAGFGGHWLAGRVLRPLDDMARHAATLTADRLDERLPVENPEDELGHLAQVFNVALGRIQESFAQLKRFTADASHELRTPLTAIRTVGEVALQHDQRPERYREAIGSMLEEVDRLTHLVGSLLVLSRADAGAILDRCDVRLLDLARESASLLEILAEEKGQRVEVRGDAAVTSRADGLILRQALVNIIDNAIKYSPRGAVISIDVRRENGSAVVEVGDEGPGIPETHRARVFERFYRIDTARSREDGGAGLGLSIALWAVQAHGGGIELTSDEGKGSTFRIFLPSSFRSR
jgi:heavy metal sensor kinase